MPLDFYAAMNDALSDGDANVSVTENGARGYRTSGHKLVDLNFAVSSLRNADESEILSRFADACGEDFSAAVVWLFFARDCRQGMGERRLFRVCARYLAQEFPGRLKALLPLFAEYGRWDDLFALLDTPLRLAVLDVVAAQIAQDVQNLRQKKPVSLLAKWLPSEKSRVPAQRKLARLLIIRFGATPRTYRKAVSALRRHLHVVEQQMSAGVWGEIDYNAVPSRANLVYRKAFLRHDEARRQRFLEDVKAGKEDVKINATVLMPYEITARYTNQGPLRWVPVDDSLEALWNALPDTVPAGAETIVVADGSGSMMWEGYDGIKPLSVAESLAIYFAQRLEGPYHNRYITFSSRPQLVSLDGASTLLGKLKIARNHDECANTNLEAVFDLVLDTAVRNHLSQAELPKNILILSDMEFDHACTQCPDARLFDSIAGKFAAHGYSLPRLVFWNLCSRTGTISVRENARGVALVSGFSQNVARMVLSGTLDPYACLMEQLHSQRYQPVWDVLKANE